MRALILYPMNALVNDQIARLRRLFGDQRLSEWFDRHYGRHPFFGAYTSRTPYAGMRDDKRDQQFVAPLVAHYLKLIQLATIHGPHSYEAQLINDLQQRGRWPAKDLIAFFGKPDTMWKNRFLTQPGDRELLTRHEMHERCPDILVTNYSMLEYMLLRPIERSMFEQTRHWLAAHPANELILVIDEAHLYRGTAGAEVAYLIRRLQTRLGIERDRMRCILTSASFGANAAIADEVIAFAAQLTGSLHTRRFQFVQGVYESRPPARTGTAQEGTALAAFQQQRFTHRAIDRAAAIAELARLAEALQWPPLPTDHDDAALRAYLYQQCYGFGPLETLIAASAGRAMSLDALAQQMFPTLALATARRATETLLHLGTYAHNGQRPLVQTRLHVLFRGLPSLWASSILIVRRVSLLPILDRCLDVCLPSPAPIVIVAAECMNSSFTGPVARLSYGCSALAGKPTSIGTKPAAGYAGQPR